MKTLVLFLTVSVISTLGYSQIENTQLMALNRDYISVETTKPTSKLLNQDYLNSVHNNSMATQVHDLEKTISQFDVTSAKGFNGNPKPFKTAFKTDNATVEVLYNKEGKIISTIEKYKKIKLPDPVRDAVFKKYKDWALLKVEYQVYYTTNDVKKIYQVKITNGKTKKKIKVNANGTMVN